jgi:phosphotransferase system HPr (HPr) family protein
VETTVALPQEVDLHARPAADLVRAATPFDSQIRIVTDGEEADAKSLLAVLGLGARRGAALRLRAQGPDADEALSALAACVGRFVS